MNKINSINLLANEILLPHSQIVVNTNNTVDSLSAQIAIEISSEKGRVILKNRGKKLIWKPISSMKRGKHIFSLNTIQFKNQKKIKSKIHIPFYVAQSPVKVSSNLAIINLKRIKISALKIIVQNIDEKPRGQFFDLVKCVHRTKNTFSEMCFNERGRKIQIKKIFDKIEKAKIKKFGKIHESLYYKLRKSRNTSLQDVAIWLKVNEQEIHPEKIKKTKSMPTQERIVRKRIDTEIRKLENKILTITNPKKLKIDSLAPVIYGRFSKKDLVKISKDPSVAVVFQLDRKGIVDLDDSIEIANSDNVHDLNIKGKGVRVAVWEAGPDNTNNLSITAFFDSSQSNTSSHARLTCGVIKNTESNAPKGHAPSCTLYSANSYDLDALRWAVRTARCTVISQSFHRRDEAREGTMSYDDVYKDWLILHSPYPTILQASGNYFTGDSDGVNPISSEYVNHKGYNSLAVGSHNDDASAMAGSSVFRNPESDHGDRELPEICANGTSVSAVGLTMGGTSFAAPAAAGVTALIQQTNSTLKSWPEGCRAILLAGAKRNVVDNTWWQDVINNNDASDGSGAVDALESVNISKNKINKNNTPRIRGWDVGTLKSSNFDSNRKSKFSYKIQIPKNSFGGKVKIALAWNSDVWTFFGIPLISRLKLDFDLLVYDSNNRLVGYSVSWDNSYEIAEFDGVPGETYTIKIRRWSGTNSTWYGIAWCVNVIPKIFVWPFPHFTALNFTSVLRSTLVVSP